jgi:hypothetical protein
VVFETLHSVDHTAKLARACPVPCGGPSFTTDATEPRILAESGRLQLARRLHKGG